MTLGRPKVLGTCGPSIVTTATHQDNQISLPPWGPSVLLTWNTPCWSVNMKMLKSSGGVISVNTVGTMIHLGGNFLFLYTPRPVIFNQEEGGVMRIKTHYLAKHHHLWKLKSQHSGGWGWRSLTSVSAVYVSSGPPQAVEGCTPSLNKLPKTTSNVEEPITFTNGPLMTNVISQLYLTQFYYHPYARDTADIEQKLYVCSLVQLVSETHAVWFTIASLPLLSIKKPVRSVLRIVKTSGLL